MRIAFDHQIFGWQEYGGISRYFCELARALACDLGEEVEVVAPWYINRYLPEIAADVAVAGRRVPRLPLGGRFYRRINDVLAAAPLRRFRPDIVHETYYAAARHAPKSAKIVLTVLDMVHERHPEGFARLDPLYREKALAVARADHVLCISECTRRDLLELLDVDPAKTSVVHLGFTRLPAPDPAPAGSGRPFLLFVGKRVPYKNFSGLLAAYAASPALRQDFDLLCFGGAPLDAAERRTIQQLGLRQDAVRHTAGSDAMLAACYRAAHALVYPSLYEGFGIPPLEAMSMDCPVACSNASSLPEVVGDAAALFDPQDTDAVRGAIERVASDDDWRRELVARGRRRLALFSWRRCAEQTQALYRKLLA